MPIAKPLTSPHFLVVALVALALAAPCQAKRVEEILEIPVSVENAYGKTVSQSIKITVFRDDEREKSPFLVLSHGRPAKPAEFAAMGRIRYTANARYFVDQGFAVLVPTRIGYGVSGGEDVEYSGTCAARNYPAVYEAAARQVLATVDLARSLPYVVADRGIVVGQSFGGTTSISIASKNPYGIIAAINFAGGGGGDPIGRPGNPCRADLLEDLFAGYGKTARIPTLWLYSQNDRYFGEKYPLEWFAGFIKQGGTGEFVALPALTPPLGEDGHSTFTRNPAAWKSRVEQFLKANGF